MQSGQANAANPYSILGLGDIAAPGLLIALMLRFDRSRSKGLSGADKTADSQKLPADKTYFITCIASYIFGLTVTVGKRSVHQRWYNFPLVLFAHTKHITHISSAETAVSACVTPSCMSV